MSANQNGADPNARHIAIFANDDEVNALAQLIDVALKNPNEGGFKVARNAGAWTQKLEEAVAERNARIEEKPRPDLRAIPADNDESDHGAA